MSKKKTSKRKRQTSSKPPSPLPTESAREGTIVPEREQGRVIETHSIQAHYGPLPTPEDFARYDAVLPGAAERILRMAEAEQQKRNDFVENDMNQFHIAQKRGQWIWLVVILAALGVIAFGLYYDQGWPAIGLGTILSVVVGYALHKSSS